MKLIEDSDNNMFWLNFIAGYVMDVTGNSNAPFLMFGAAQALGGALIIPIPWIKSKLEKEESEIEISADR